MAEGAGLLNQYAGNRIEGSNPSPSAISFYETSSVDVEQIDRSPRV